MACADMSMVTGKLNMFVVDVFVCWMKRMCC